MIVWQCYLQRAIAVRWTGEGGAMFEPSVWRVKRDSLDVSYRYKGFWAALYRRQELVAD